MGPRCPVQDKVQTTPSCLLSPCPDTEKTQIPETELFLAWSWLLSTWQPLHPQGLRLVAVGWEARSGPSDLCRPSLHYPTPVTKRPREKPVLVKLRDQPIQSCKLRMANTAFSPPWESDMVRVQYQVKYRPEPDSGPVREITTTNQPLRSHSNPYDLTPTKTQKTTM